MRDTGKRGWLGWLYGTALPGVLLLLDLPEYIEKAKRMADILGSVGIDAIRWVLWVAFFFCLVMTIYYALVAPRLAASRARLTNTTDSQAMKGDEEVKKPASSMQFNVGTAINSPFGNTFNFAKPARRVLSAEQQDILRREAMKGGRSTVWIRVDSGSSEAMAFGGQIVNALHKAPGWEMYPAHVGGDVMPPGVTLHASTESPDPEALLVLQRAFRAAGISFRTVMEQRGPAEGVTITVSTAD